MWSPSKFQTRVRWGKSHLQWCIDGYLRHSDMRSNISGISQNLLSEKMQKGRLRWKCLKPLKRERWVPENSLLSTHNSDKKLRVLTISSAAITLQCQRHIHLALSTAWRFLIWITLLRKPDALIANLEMSIVVALCAKEEHSCTWRKLRISCIFAEMDNASKHCCTIVQFLFPLVHGQLLNPCPQPFNNHFCCRGVGLPLLDSNLRGWNPQYRLCLFVFQHKTEPNLNAHLLCAEKGLPGILKQTHLLCQWKFKRISEVPDTVTANLAKWSRRKIQTGATDFGFCSFSGGASAEEVWPGR